MYVFNKSAEPKCHQILTNLIFKENYNILPTLQDFQVYSV